MARVTFLAFLIIVSASSALAASYKCQDASGKWSEQACPDYAARQQQAADQAAAEAKLKNWRPKIGMTADEVRNVIDNKNVCKNLPFEVSFRWCSCRSVNGTVNSRGVQEQWVFRCDGEIGGSYLYFDNGVLTSIQE